MVLSLANAQMIQQPVSDLRVRSLGAFSWLCRIRHQERHCTGRMLSALNRNHDSESCSMQSHLQWEPARTLNLSMSPGQNRRKSLSFSSSERGTVTHAARYVSWKITTAAMLRQDTTPPVMNAFALEALSPQRPGFHLRGNLETRLPRAAETHCCWKFHHSWIKGSGSKIAPFRGALCPVQVLTQSGAEPDEWQKGDSVHQTSTF